MADVVPPAGDRSASTGRVVVSTSLDDIRSSHVRFLQEAARLGAVHVRLPSDPRIVSDTGLAPRFPQAERLFMARALRYAAGAVVVERSLTAALPDLAGRFARVVVAPDEVDPDLRARCAVRGIDYRVVDRRDLEGFPAFDPGVDEVRPPRAAVEDATAKPVRLTPRVVVTGCFDWLHSGHVKFFMDAAALGALYVVVGSDRNVRLLKGPGHPLQSQDERRYMVQAVRSVHRCLVSSGHGWTDAEPEIDAIAPDVYVVNEDGDQPEKREFCRAHGLEYIVLERRPHADLPRRNSTDLRGF